MLGCCCIFEVIGTMDESANFSSMNSFYDEVASRMLKPSEIIDIFVVYTPNQIRQELYDLVS